VLEGGEAEHEPWRRDRQRYRVFSRPHELVTAGVVTPARSIERTVWQLWSAMKVPFSPRGYGREDFALSAACQSVITAICSGAVLATGRLTRKRW
jgi:hypothetical protein